jgi:hypothetical protein
LANFNLGKSYESAKESLDTLKLRLTEYEKMMNNPAQYLYDFFKEIEAEINRKKDHVKMMVDLKAESMLKDLSLFKSECQSSLEMNVVKFEFDRVDPEKLNELRDKLEKWYDELSKPVGLGDPKWNRIHSESENDTNELNTKLIELKKRLFLNIDCRFEEKRVDLKSNIFGELKMVFYKIKIFFC